MKKLLLHTLFAAGFAGALCAQPNKTGAEYVANEIFVKLTVPVDAATLQYLPHPDNPPPANNSVWDVVKNGLGESMTRAFDASFFPALKDVYVVKFKPGANMDSIVDVLSARRDVEYANRVGYAKLQHIPTEINDGKQWYFSKININSAWWSTNPGPQHINIAVIDNAIRYTHEDLRRKLMVSYDVPGDGIDNDNNGYTDDAFGWDVANNDNNPAPPVINSPWLPRLYFSHGTHVAGIIAADDNNTGAASMGVNNRILCIKATPDNGENDLNMSILHIVQAIEYAVKRGVNVINCSFGTETDDPTLQAAIQEAVQRGIIVVGAAGNYENDKPFYPAAYDGVIAVGATDQNDRKFQKSNYGGYIDVMAPGKDIYSTVSTGDDKYDYMSGTSMAAPIVSSLVGLLLNEMGTHRSSEIERIIKGGCDNIDNLNTGYAGRLGAGRINVDNSFNYMLTNSVEGVAEYTSFSVYPNPAANTILLPFETLSPGGQPLEVTVFNSAGVEVSKTQVAYAGQTIDVSQLPQGIYNITTLSHDNRYFQSRLLVNR